MDEGRFEKLYPIIGTSQWIVLDGVEKKLCLRKELEHYDLSVYNYLLKHSNPNVAAVIDFYEKEGKLIVFEEYIQARTLEEVLEQELLSFEESKRIFLEICDGILFFHNADVPIVHRDLKLSNILFTDDRVVKIVDYDASIIIDREKNRDDVLIGTEGYAAPEQYGLSSSDERTDVYALGIIGRKLFPSSKYEHILKKATCKDPKKRYQSVEELKNIINNTMRKTKPLLPPPGFRTGNSAHMLLAILCDYFWFGIIMQDVPVDTKYLHFIPSHFLIYFFMYLAAVDVWTDWTGLFEGLPDMKNNKKNIRICARCVFSFLAMIAVSAIIRLIDLMLWEIITLF